MLSRGAGTSLAGQCTDFAVILDFSRYLNRLLEVDADAGWVRVEPGIVLDALQAEVKPLRWFFAPDPANALALHVGRHDRQQLLRITCAVWRQDGRQHARVGGSVYHGTVMNVGPVTEAEIDGNIAEGGRRAEIIRSLRTLRDEIRH